MQPAVPLALEPWPVRRILSTARHYGRRAWRWWRIVREYRPGSVSPRPGERRVLIVRLDAIGDFVLWSGAAKLLRRWLGADAHVTLAANAVWADFARDADIADDVWPVHLPPLEWDASYRSEMQARVEGGRFTMAINPVFSREMMRGDSMVRWSRASQRIGSSGEGLLLPPRERRWANRWYTTLTPASPAWMHECERNAEFLRALGVAFAEVPAPDLIVHPLRLARLDDLPEGFFIVFPGAGLPGRRWGASEFAAAARHVQKHTGWRPVLLGDGVDAPVTRAVAAEVPGAIDLAGETSVRILASVIRRSRLVLTNETSAVHLAAALRVPAVCIAGGGHWERFVPYPKSLGTPGDFVELVSMEKEMTCFRCNWRCVLPHVAGEPLPCVNRVPLERVIEAVDRILSRLTVAHTNG